MNNNGIRLQKWLALAGVASRRKVEEMILAGRVCVNGEVVATLGTKANPDTDAVTVDGKPAELDSQQKVYILLHKPTGVVTTVSDQFGRPTVMGLLPPDITTRLYPVGRLDYDTSGLLLLTNDGDWAQKLTHPKYEVDKTYVAVVEGAPSTESLKAFCRGLIIEGKKTAPCEVKIEDKINGRTKLRIHLREGRNRQVRKMCEAIGHKVVSLKRVSVGNINLGGLQRGKWRHLTPSEVCRSD